MPYSGLLWNMTMKIKAFRATGNSTHDKILTVFTLFMELQHFEARKSYYYKNQSLEQLYGNIVLSLDLYICEWGIHSYKKRVLDIFSQI